MVQGGGGGGGAGGLEDGAEEENGVSGRHNPGGGRRSQTNPGRQSASLAHPIPPGGVRRGTESGGGDESCPPKNDGTYGRNSCWRETPAASAMRTTIRSRLTFMRQALYHTSGSQIELPVLARSPTPGCGSFFLPCSSSPSPHPDEANGGTEDHDEQCRRPRLRGGGRGGGWRRDAGDPPGGRLADDTAVQAACTARHAVPQPRIALFPHP